MIYLLTFVIQRGNKEPGGECGGECGAVRAADRLLLTFDPEAKKEEEGGSLSFCSNAAPVLRFVKV